MAESPAAVVLSILLLVPSAFTAQAQNPVPPVANDATGSAKPAPTTTPPVAVPNTESEISTYDKETDFKVRVNLVLARVVVRDSSGNAVANLRKEDFRLLDNGKPQTLSTFTIETPQSEVIKAVTTEAPKESPPPAIVVANAEPVNPTVAFPQRFVALVFDDVHLETKDALAVRHAITQLSAAISPTDRVAVYTTSGQVTEEFTGDRETLQKALQRIVPRPNRVEDTQQCPYLTYYLADLIWNKHDAQALAAVAAEASTNCGLGARDVQAAAQRVLEQGDADTRSAYRNVDSLIRYLSNMPGQRVIVFVSPGFILGQDLQTGTWDVIDRAVHSGVVINTIDARGLYTADYLPDIAGPPEVAPDKTQVDWQGLESTYRVQAQFEQGTTLQGLAAATGGTYFHNRNDIGAGISQALAAPAVTYLLGFSPQDLKRDGKFHTLKVSLTNGEKYQIQTRHGYFAPKIIADPEEMAKQEVRAELFAQDEVLNIPIQLETQFFKVDAGSARLTVLTHLEVKAVRFRKIEGRNDDNLTIATAIFDKNGQFVKGEMKEIAFKLKDETYEHMNHSGFTVKIDFDVKPGSYFIRTVVRGAEGPQLTARNGTAVIPN